MRVLLGSRNRGKVLGVESFFRELYGDVVVDSVDVSGLDIPGQPVGVGETIAGAFKRARYVFGLGGYDLYVGVEGGVSPLDVNGLELYLGFHAAVVIDSGGRCGVGLSSSYLLPRDVGRRAMSEELGYILAGVLGSRDYREVGGYIGYLTSGRVTRVDLTREAVRNAYYSMLYGGVRLDT